MSERPPPDNAALKRLGTAANDGFAALKEAIKIEAIFQRESPKDMHIKTSPPSTCLKLNI